MAWWIYLIFTVASQAIGILSRPRNEKPKGEIELKLPAIDPSRPMPVCWGEWIVKDPQLVWWGDLWAKPIYQTSILTLGLIKTLIGYRIFLGMVFSTGHGDTQDTDGTTLHEVLVKGRVPLTEAVVGPWTNNTVPVTIRDPQFYGSNKHAGGLLAKTWWYKGTQTAVNAYWQARIAEELPTYRGGTLFIWEGPRGAILSGLGGFFNLPSASGWLGNAGPDGDFIPPEFWLKQSRNPKFGSGVIGTIGDGPMTNGRQANPAWALYDLLTHPNFGPGYDPTTEVDFESFEDAATTLWNEGFAFAYYWTQDSPAEEMADEILRYIDGALVEDRTTGKLKLKLARADYDPDDLPTLDETSFKEITTCVRAAWRDTINEVKIKYTDHSTTEFLEHEAIAQDGANWDTQGGQHATEEIVFRGCPYRALAEKLAERELNARALPLLRLTGKLDRSVWDYEVGDVFKFVSPEHGQQVCVMRVAAITDGTPGNNFYEIQAVEDVFGVNEAVYTTNTGSWVDPNSDAEPAEHALALEAPYYFSISSDPRALVACAEPPPDTTHVVWDALLNDEEDQADIEFAPTATLLVDYIAFTPRVDDTFSLVLAEIVRPDLLHDCSPQHIPLGINLALLYNEDEPAEQEWIAFERVEDNLDGTYTLSDVHRGLLDTPPIAHATGVRFWLLTDANAILSKAIIGADVIKHLPRTISNRLDPDDATEFNVVPVQRANAPYPMAAFGANFSYGDTVIETGDITFAWHERNRLTQGTILDQNWGTVEPEADVQYEILVLSLDGLTEYHRELIDNAITLTPNRWEYTQIEQEADGVDGVDLRIEGRAIRNDVLSFRPFVFNIYRSTTGHETEYLVYDGADPVNDDSDEVADTV